MNTPRKKIRVFFNFFIILLSVPIFCSSSKLRLPDTSHIDRNLIDNLTVDHFFNLWIVFNNADEINVIKDEDYTILAPKNTAILKDETLIRRPELIKKLLMDHLVLGQALNLFNVHTFSSFTVQTSSGRNVTFNKKEEQFYANEAKILETQKIGSKGSLLVLDTFLFADDDIKIARENSVLGMEQGKNVTFIDNVMQVLTLLKSGVRVFQHFLNKSNVSNILEKGEHYTVFVPTDHAFQRWHPIDWGFYPFSVPEFTESIIINHFVKGKLKQDAIKTNQAYKTLGGRDITFKKTPNLTVNNVPVVKGDTPVPEGNIMFIGEVLFVSEAVVSRLHQQHKDKETPPLLAFPWFGAQFLSHAFLALERDRRFGHITRFLNLADLAPHVSGTGYTFFVPTDTAFEEIGLDKMPDNYLSTGSGIEILLNHFVKGRLYDRDLVDGSVLHTLGNKTITIKRKGLRVLVNNATIVESEVFVYNLGTMFYIDQVLFGDLVQVATNKTPMTVTTLPKEVETVPEELVETSGSLPDVLFADATVQTEELSTIGEVINRN